MRDAAPSNTRLAARLRVDKQGFSLDVDFEVSGATVLFGPSGSGKTLTIRALAGLEPLSEGRITLGALDAPRPICDTRTGVLLPAEQRRIGVVFQEPRLFPHLTVLANLLYGKRRETPAARLDEITALMELGPLLSRRPRRLSGGEKQRVAIGRALLSDPDALLMDEPLTALDTRLKSEILPYLTRLRDETSAPILYVTHDMAEAKAIGQRLLRIEKGRIVGDELLETKRR